MPFAKIARKINWSHNLVPSVFPFSCPPNSKGKSPGNEVARVSVPTQVSLFFPRAFAVVNNVPPIFLENGSVKRLNWSLLRNLAFEISRNPPLLRPTIIISPTRA